MKNRACNFRDLKRYLNYRCLVIRNYNSKLIQIAKVHQHH